MAANNQVNYNEPWILQRADPYVFFKDGYYYFTASVPAYDGIITEKIQDIKWSGRGRGKRSMAQARIRLNE